MCPAHRAIASRLREKRNIARAIRRLFLSIDPRQQSDDFTDVDSTTDADTFLSSRFTPSSLPPSQSRRLNPIHENESCLRPRIIARATWRALAIEWDVRLPPNAKVPAGSNLQPKFLETGRRRNFGRPNWWKLFQDEWASWWSPGIRRWGEGEEQTSMREQRARMDEEEVQEKRGKAGWREKFEICTCRKEYR